MICEMTIADTATVVSDVMEPDMFSALVATGNKRATAQLKVEEDSSSSGSSCDSSSSDSEEMVQVNKHAS